MSTPTLWHYTCEHGHDKIGDEGVLLPAVILLDGDPRVPWNGQVVWLTDLPMPNVWALGLTSLRVSCDRTAYRYRVTDTRDCVPWPRLRRRLLPDMRDEIDDLEGHLNARPAHWWCCSIAVPAVYDPVTTATPVSRTRSRPM